MENPRVNIKDCRRCNGPTVTVREPDGLVTRCLVCGHEREGGYVADRDDLEFMALFSA